MGSTWRAARLRPGRGKRASRGAYRCAASLGAFFAALIVVLATCAPMASGETITAGQQLVSANGSYRAVMQTDGNLVVYGPSGAIWSSGTSGSGGEQLVLQSDGNLVIYTAAGRSVWATGTEPSCGDTIVMQNDGNLVVYAGNHAAIWSSETGKLSATRPGCPAVALRTGETLSAGQEIESPALAYRAVMQTDGNFVVYGPNGSSWASGTFGTGATHVVMQGDGNLVIYTAASKAVWATGTEPSCGDTLNMQDDGNLVAYAHGHVATWSALTGNLHVARAGCPASTLGNGQTLSAGQDIASPDVNYRATMQTDGNLVVYGPNGPTWASGTQGSGGNHVVMQTDGNLVLYTAAGRSVWATGSEPSCGDSVTIQDDGNLVVYDQAGTAVWSSSTGEIGPSRGGCPPTTLGTGQTLPAGHALASPDLAYQAAMQTDGNFVVYGPNGAIWSSGTGGTGANEVVMQTDGNLVIYVAGGASFWQTSTEPASGATLTMQNDGNLVLYASGTALWSSKTGKIVVPPPANCTANNSCAPPTFSQVLLAEPKVAAPVTGPNIYAMETWERAEGGGAGCPSQPPKTAPWAYSSGPAGNPINTTQPDAGSQPTPWNSVNVQQFQNANGQTCWYWGVYATYVTLINGNYGPILNALDHPVSTDKQQCVDLARAVGSTPWGTGDFEADC